MSARPPENGRADDRVLPVTRVVAACVVPFLLIAFASLYLRPDLSATHFAWRIAPNFTAFWLATGYLGGAWFFFRVTRARRWHEVALGFLPVTVFVWLMLLLTVLFWDRFDLHHFPFQLWLGLYLVTPIVVPALWWRNRRHDPHRLEPGDIVVPGPVRAAMGGIGSALVGTALWMLLAPQAAIAAWGWTLTPVSACAMGGWLALSGVGGWVLAAEPRWSAWRVLIQSMLIWLALLTVGAWRARDEFDPARPGFLAVVAVPASLVGLGALYLLLERRRKAASR